MANGSPISRVLVAAAAMDANEARRVLMMVCRSGITDAIPRGRMTRAESIHHKRANVAAKMHETIGRVLDYAKHETLRNVERHFRTVLKAASLSPPDEPPKSTVRINFDPEGLQQDLLLALESDQVEALQTAGSELIAEIGRSNPWRMPAEATIQFIRHRANLLSGVSDEIHQEIEDVLAKGLDAQLPLRDLAASIRGKFEEIYKGRGKVIADTETAAAYGFARNKAMLDAGITKKKWLHSPLAKEPRPEHLEANGMVVDADKPFPVGNPPLMYPHDPNGSPEDVINCHCISIPVQ